MPAALFALVAFVAFLVVRKGVNDGKAAGYLSIKVIDLKLIKDKSAESGYTNLYLSVKTEATNKSVVPVVIDRLRVVVGLRGAVLAETVKENVKIDPGANVVFLMPVIIPVVSVLRVAKDFILNNERGGASLDVGYTALTALGELKGVKSFKLPKIGKDAAV